MWVQLAWCAVCLGLCVAGCGDGETVRGFEPIATDGGTCVPNPETNGIEVCNGLDDDCSGIPDDDSSGRPLRQPCSTACGPGVEQCVQARWTECDAPEPQPEQCNGLDDDCNGRIDDGIECECSTGSTRPCGLDVGRCKPGVQQCIGGQWQTECFGAIGPAEQEICGNGIDDTCDGRIDGDCECTPGEAQSCGTDVGACVSGMVRCEPDGRWSDRCVGEVPARRERCNGLDDNCDGRADWNVATDFGWSRDPFEPNNTCDGATRLPEAVDSGATTQVPVRDRDDLRTYPTLYPPGTDVDWYRFRAEEVSRGACVPFTAQCAFVLAVRLSLEEGADPEDYELCVATADRCADVTDQTLICATGDQWVAASSSYVLGLKWGGACARDDSRTVHVRVRSRPGRAACGYYQLSARFAFDPDETCP